MAVATNWFSRHLLFLHLLHLERLTKLSTYNVTNWNRTAPAAEAKSTRPVSTSEIACGTSGLRFKKSFVQKEA